MKYLQSLHLLHHSPYSYIPDLVSYQSTQLPINGNNDIILTRLSNAATNTYSTGNLLAQKSIDVSFHIVENITQLLKREKSIWIDLITKPFNSKFQFIY